MQLFLTEWKLTARLTQTTKLTVAHNKYSECYEIIYNWDPLLYYENFISNVAWSIWAYIYLPKRVGKFQNIDQLHDLKIDVMLWYCSPVVSDMLEFEILAFKMLLNLKNTFITNLNLTKTNGIMKCSGNIYKNSIKFLLSLLAVYLLDWLHAMHNFRYKCFSKVFVLRAQSLYKQNVDFYTIVYFFVIGFLVYIIYVACIFY